jgi:hypothetical protein
VRENKNQLTIVSIGVYFFTTAKQMVIIELERFYTNKKAAALKPLLFCNT